MEDDKKIGQFYSEDKVPLEQVLKDMYEDSGVETAARAYYYQHYATPEERIKMDREDWITRAVTCIISVGILIAAAISVISLFSQIG